MSEQKCCAGPTPVQKAGTACGCESSGQPAAARNPERWMTGSITTAAGDIPLVSTALEWADRAGSWKCRWSIGRMDYAVEPGLYGVGRPDGQSPVLVTANYKMTFDRVRRDLSGLDAWLLVLDTDGVNVWCAAGKGTFGTEELVRRIRAAHLSRIVTHRTVIVPQLGATGISAHEAAQLSGFRVVYGPVRSADIRAFLAGGMQATDAMRTVTFPLRERLVLTPMELVASIKPLLYVFGVLFLLNAFGIGRFGRLDVFALAGAVVSGCVITPALLPWIPGRAFSFKGFLTGLAWTAVLLLLHGFPAAAGFGWPRAIAYLLALPALSAFMAMNFTGSSTFTSLSGVDREMRTALPLMLSATGMGVMLLLADGIAAAFGWFR